MLALLVGIVVVGAIVAIVASGGDSDRLTDSSDGGDDTVADGSSDDSVGGGAPDPAGDDDEIDDDEIDDIAPCQWVDAETIVLDVTNNSSKQSTYVIDVNFLDADGNRVGDEPFFVNYVRPGERAVEESFVFDSAGGVDCEIAEVERFAAESADDVGEVTCETAGVDFADDIATTFVATNGSSELSDYFATGALIRDGIRIGTAFASIDNVRPGESAPGDGFSLVDGPDTGVTCEVVDVQRLSSE